MLKLHFLNVGHGDCTFIELPSGRLMMVDINNSKTLPEQDLLALAAHHGLRSWQVVLKTPEVKRWEDYYRSLLVDPVDYYRANFDGRAIFRYIQTHPDMDHMSGLFRFFMQEAIPLGNFWDLEHTKQCGEADFESSPYDYADWVAYRLLRLGGGPGDREHRVLHLTADAVGHFFTDDNIQILSPTPDLVSECNDDGSWNDASYVLRISYAGRTVILPGDAEKDAWDGVLSRSPKAQLACDILKAAHHGRESGYHAEAVRAMDPSLVICSVGKKPDTDASDKYAAHGATVLSTRYNGTITITIWQDGEVWVNDHRGDRVETLPPLAA